MKNFIIPRYMIIAVIALGCAEQDPANVPPVLTALDQMEALEKAAEDAKVREAMANASSNAMSTDSEGGVSETYNFPAAGTYVVDFETTVGNFTITVHREWSPWGADRFYKLVKDRFYDGCGFFRVVPDFMVQFGLAADPAATAKWNASIPDDRVKQSNKRGYVTFAKTSSPNSRSTQVFINFKANDFLDNQGFSPFGEVTSGMDVVDRISSAHGEQPNQGKITEYGNEYLKSAFPQLDYITTARITVDDMDDSAQPDSADPAIPATE